MKKIFSFIIILFATISVFSQQLSIEPAFWWSGMQESELQLMVYGNNIADYKATIASPHVYLKESVTLESPNYKLLYLDISKSIPETFDIVFTNGKKKITIPYELKQRDPSRKDIKGFDSSDVLYLIMPDRFANGDPTNDQIPMRMPYKVDRNDPNARHGGDLNNLSYGGDNIPVTTSGSYLVTLDLSNPAAYKATIVKQ